MQLGLTQQVERPFVGVSLCSRHMDYRKESGKRLRAARVGKNLTLDELSRRIGGGLSASRLSNYEQGLRMLGVRESLALYSVLGVSPAHLLCVDIEEGDMTSQETELLRNFRALPERDRNDYARRIGVLALAYREPVPDEKLSVEVRTGASVKKRTTSK
jgi:transcriptional regulator with XRE-family HTH domain